MRYRRVRAYGIGFQQENTRRGVCTGGGSARTSFMIQVFNQYVSPKRVVLILLEACLIALALLCGVRIRFWNSVEGFNGYIALPEFTLQALAFVITLQVCFYYCQLYSPSAIRGRNEQWIAMGQSLGSGCLLLGILYYIFPELLLGRGIFFISVALVPAFVALNRVTLDRIWQATPKEHVLIFGTARLASVVAAELAKRNDLNVKFAGFVEPSGTSAGRTDLARGPVIGRAEDLQAIAKQHAISRIIVALEDRRNTLPIRDLLRLKVQGIRVEDAQSVIAALTGRVWLETVRPSWFVFSDGFRRSSVTLIVKRALDLACAMVGLILSLPLMLLVAAVVRVDSPGPVIYRQRRVGLRGKCFDVLKFRSMRSDAENGTGARWAVTNDPRVTRVGRFLRKYRLDELPQFINVVRGEMSFVGPRPERPEFVEELRKEIPYYDERHSVRPGITGWAQVQYEYGSSVEDAMRKLEYDLFYLKNMSPLFDCAIILDTIGIVLTGHGGR
jgi:sugar transferase (PEP-CTERM system associated)